MIEQSELAQTTNATRSKSELRKLSVCHVASGDSWAGAEVQIAALLRSLQGRRDVDLRVILLNDGRLAQEVRRNGIELAVIPEKSNTFTATVSRAAEFLRGRSVDVLHAHRDKEYLVSLLIRGKVGRPFLVRTQHGRPEPYSGWHALKSTAIHAVDRRLVRWSAAKVVSVSDELKAYLKTYVRDEQIAVVRNGLDLTQVASHLTRAEAKARLGFSAGTPVVGTVGRLVPVKRVDLFIRMAANILQANPGARFVVAGDGRDFLPMEQLCAQLGVADQVRLLGHRDDVYDVMRAMDVMVVSSDREGTPMTVLEAMHLGVPIVSRRVGGIPEVIEHERSGMLVAESSPDALARACLRLLTDTDLASWITATARREVAEKLSAEANAARMLQLYRSFRRSA